MDADFHIRIDRGASAPLTEQISSAVGAAIRDGRLSPGARLPSWHDLAAQLGVARGTVRMAYEALRDQQLVFTAGAAGTRVALHISPAARRSDHAEGARLAEIFPSASTKPGIFQLGVPAQDGFPFKTWSRIMGRTARAAAIMPLCYPDPRGEIVLRSEIAAYLCMARGVECTPSQVFITNGFSGALGVALRALQVEGKCAWTEEPGFPLTRNALVLSGVTPVPVAVDAEGLDVAAGIAAAPQAAFAIVTAGQHAPLGVTLSLPRRHALLDWAARSGAWIIEDDYLGELQLRARATPALAALDRSGRVLHIGTFSKTINPGLRVGFLVAPAALATRVANVATAFASAPTPAIQFAVAEFMRSGHYLRHLRHMKRLYVERRRVLAACLSDMSVPYVEAGLAILLRLPDDVRDTEVAAQANAAGLSPSPLSWWYARPQPDYGGLLLGVTNLREERIADYCKRLVGIWSR